MNKKVNLPKDVTVEADFYDVSWPLLSLQRDSEGTVYLVTYWYGIHNVIAYVKANGESWQVESD